MFGEKVRALAERTRPRDLYDVINLFRNVEALPAPAVLRDVLTQKCEFKGIGMPALAGLEAIAASVEGLWVNMLQHQLPSLPPYETFWSELPSFFAWRRAVRPRARPPPSRSAQGKRSCATACCVSGFPLRHRR